MKLKMFHIPKPKQFNYKPVFYVPDEEESYSAKKEKDRLSSDAFRAWHKEAERMKNKRNTNILLYLAIAAALLLFILY